jgi:NAD(P)H-nitrite reductase large subunit
LGTTSEKIIKQDTERKYDIVVIGEESHVAYNRVGLSTFFEHRKIEDLYLNPAEWVSPRLYKSDREKTKPNKSR